MFNLAKYQDDGVFSLGSIVDKNHLNFAQHTLMPAIEEDGASESSYELFNAQQAVRPGYTKTSQDVPRVERKRIYVTELSGQAGICLTAIGGLAKKAVETALDRRVALASQAAFFKPAHVGASVPWHQDAAYLQETLHRRLHSIWVPLIDTDIDNGCMHYIPGSHHEGLGAHHVWQTTEHGRTILEGLPSTLQMERCITIPAVAGEMIMHHGLTFHMSQANLSERSRLALIFDFLEQSPTLGTP